MAIEIAEVLEVGPGWNKVRATDGNIYTLRGDYNWRSNNPGNIEYGPFAISMGAIGSGAVPAGRERGFAIFPNPQAGEKAREALQFESPSYRDLTISQAISRYAPPSENDTRAYINAVTSAAGVSPNTKMSDLTPQQRTAFLAAQAQVEGNMRQGEIYNAQGIRLPPAEIPNVVASQLDVTPQTRNVPLPRPRPTPPSMPTPRQQRLPDIGSTSSPVGPGPTSLASVQDMYGRPQTNRLDPIGLGPLSLANVQGMYGRGGVGLPPATRSVPSVPFRPTMNAIGTMPSFGQFQAQFGRPAVATQLATARPVVGFPTPVSQRPAQRTIGFPTPANIRPAMAQPQQAPLQVTVQGANSYSAPQPQYVSTTGQALQPRQTVRYNPDTNTFVPVTLYEPTQRQERRSSISGPAQSLV